MSLRAIEAHVLDLLVDGESSFAALFYGLRGKCGHTEADVNEVLGLVQHLDDSGLVQAQQMDPDGSFRSPVAADYERVVRDYGEWLPRATADEVSCDDVGLWYSLTDRGREAWSRWSGGREEDREVWMLDDLADRGILEVRARRTAVAEAKLDKWLEEHVDMHEIPRSRETIRIAEFVLRDGTRILDAVLVRCRYRLEKRVQGE